MKIFLIIVVFVVLTSLSCGHKWDSTTYDLVSRVYAHAIVYPENFAQFVSENSELFTNNSNFENCISEVAAAMANSALRAPSRSAIEEQSMRIASDAGVPELGSSVANDIMKTSGELYRVASYLKQIQNSVPLILNGNNTYYQSSEVYSLNLLVWNIAATYMSQQELNKIRELTYKLSYWYMSSLLKSM